MVKNTDNTAYLKKELAKVLKKLSSSNTKKHLDALGDLKDLISLDVRAIKPAYNHLDNLLKNGTEEERFMVISIVRTAVKAHPASVNPLINGVIQNLRYPIFDPDLRFSISGCKIRAIALVTVLNIGETHPSIFKDPDVAKSALENIEPPIYVNKAQRPAELQRLYQASLRIIKNISSIEGSLLKDKIPSILNLLNDPSIDIKISTALVIEQISLEKPEYLYNAINRITSVLKYPIYRPDTSDQKLANLYICTLATLNNLTDANSKALVPIMSLISGVLRDSYKYERWANDGNDRGSFRSEITTLITKLSHSEPDITANTIAEHLKEVETLRKFIFTTLNDISMDRPKAVVDALVPLLSDENVNSRQMSVHLMGEIGERNPDVVRPHIPIIIRLLEDRYIHVRQRAAYALGKIGSVKPEYVYNSVPTLVPLLSDSYEAVRIYTIDAIARIGEAHTKYVIAAIPSLIKLLDDPNVKVKQMAMAALKKLDIDVKLYSELLRAMQTVNKEIVQIKAMGASPDIIEVVFSDAKKDMQNANWRIAKDKIDKAAKIVKFIRSQARPAIDVKFTLDTRVSNDGWSPLIIDIANKGSAHAKDIKISFDSGIDIKGSSMVPVLESKSGIEMKLEGRLLSEKGSPFTLTLTYSDFADTEFKYNIEGKTDEALKFEYRDPYKPQQQKEQLYNFMKTIGLEDYIPEEDIRERAESTETVGEEEAITEEDEMEEFPTVAEDKDEPRSVAPENKNEDKEQQPKASEEHVKDETKESNAEARWKDAGVNELMTCPHCGAKIPIDSTFCYKCGKRVK